MAQLEPKKGHSVSARSSARAAHGMRRVRRLQAKDHPQTHLPLHCKGATSCLFGKHFEVETTKDAKSTKKI